MISEKWRQGALLTSEHAAAIAEVCPGLLKHEPGSVIIVISHDCDIANETGAEPEIEFIEGKYVTDIDGNFTFAKNPRTVAIRPTGDLTRWMVFSANDKRKVSRELFHEVEPSLQGIESNERRVLALWLARRYRRAALPDEFNRRIAGVKPKLLALLKAYAQNITALYISLSTVEELAEPNAYKVMLSFLVTEDTHADESLATKCSVLAKKIAELIESCELVEVISYELISEDEFTLADARVSIQWDFEDITIRGEHVSGPSAA